MKRHSSVGLITNSSTTIYYSEKYISLPVSMIIECNTVFHFLSSFRQGLMHNLKPPFIYSMFDAFGQKIIRHEWTSRNYTHLQNNRIDLMNKGKLQNTNAKQNVFILKQYYSVKSTPMFKHVHPIPKGTPRGSYNLFVEGLKGFRKYAMKHKALLRDCGFAYVRLKGGFVGYNGQDGYGDYLDKSRTVGNYPWFELMYSEIFQPIEQINVDKLCDYRATWRNALPRVEGSPTLASYHLELQGANNETT